MDDRSTTRAPLERLHSLELANAALTIQGGLKRGARCALGTEGVLIGCGSQADVQLLDPLVSRAHARLVPQPDGVRLVDLESLNGTLIGALKVHDVTLAQQTTFMVGETPLELSFRPEPLSVQLSPRTTFGEAFGASRSMRHVFAQLESVVDRDVTVLLEGASGTGKDLLATSLHKESPRKDGPLVVVDCGALADGLIQTELFGHECGAFTNADSLRVGAFEAAQGGTVFLDEIGELAPALQATLLRVLESRRIRRVGGDEEIEVDVRVIAATNQKLLKAVEEGRFRSDLYYRLAVVCIRVPTLAQRRQDIEQLARSFYRKSTGDSDASLPAGLLALLVAYDWPGNVRELRNVVERFSVFGRTHAAALFDAEPVASEDSLGIAISQLAGLTYHYAKEQLLAAFHRRFLSDAVERAGSVSEAAKKLGIPRPSLHRMLSKVRPR